MRATKHMAFLLAIGATMATADDILFERDTTANWSAQNPVLRAGEPGVNLDTKELRIGDGVSTWSALTSFWPHPAVTLAAGRDYLTINGQQISLGQIDLATDVTGTLPWSSITSTPTTVAGYGITDALSESSNAADLSSGSATAGQLLSADGAGGAAWADLSASYEPLGAAAAQVDAHDMDPAAHELIQLSVSNITDAGTMAAQSADDVAITGGYVTGLASLSVTDGLRYPAGYYGLPVGKYWSTATSATAQSTTISMTENDFRLVPIAVPERRYMSEALVEVTTQSTSGNIRGALYSLNAAYTGATIVTNSATDAVSTSTTGVKTLTFPEQVELAPGVYLLALGVDQAVTIRATAQNSTIPLLGADPAMGNAVLYTMIRDTGWTYAAMPGTLNLTGLTWQGAQAPPLALFPIEDPGAVTPPAERITYAYLEDGVAVDPADDYDYPKIHGGPPNDTANLTAMQRSKYHAFTRNGTDLSACTAAKAINPNLYCWRYVSAFGLNNNYTNTWPVGVPFSNTGASTNFATETIFAGHFTYEPFTQLASAITTAGQTSVSVDDGSRFVVGDYAVIYNDGTNFTDAEHVRITAIAGNSLTLQRGYRSTAGTHVVDSRIAAHARAGGAPASSQPENWMMHMGSNCPQDGSGNRFNTLFGQFWAANLKKDANYQTVAAVDGIIWDMDTPTIIAQSGPNVDTNNDGTQDNGRFGTTDVWRIGIEAMYDALMAANPSAIINGGQKYALGWGDQKGGQFEVFPRDGEGTEVGDYSEMSGFYYDMLLGSYYRRGTTDAGYMENELKSPTALYGGGTTNKYARFDMAMTWIAGGTFGTHTGSLNLTEEPWYDEFAVDLTPGANYGHAVASNPSDESAARAAIGWLGKPLGPPYRVYGTEMNPANAIYADDFDADISGWTGTETTLAFDGSDGNLSGNGSLSIGAATQIGTYPTAIAKGDINVSLTAGSPYTLAFSAKCADWTHIQPAIVWPQEDNVFLVGPQWDQFVYNFNAPATGALDLHFRVGRDSIACKVDDLIIVPGRSNIFRRDFENGTLIANGTGSPITVNTEDTYQRIVGTGQDDINDGTSGTTWPIAAWDAAILVKPDN